MIQTERLKLKPVERPDIALLHQISIHCSDGMIGLDYESVGVSQFYDRMKNTAKKTFCIIFKERLIGYIQIQIIEFNCSVTELVIMDTYRKEGLGVEAVLEIIDYSFNKLIVHRVECSVYGVNRNLDYMLSKVPGLKKEGIKREVAKVDGEWYDIAIWATLDKDFFKNYTSRYRKKEK